MAQICRHAFNRTLIADRIYGLARGARELCIVDAELLYEKLSAPRCLSSCAFRLLRRGGVLVGGAAGVLHWGHAAVLAALPQDGLDVVGHDLPPRHGLRRLHLGRRSPPPCLVRLSMREGVADNCGTVAWPAAGMLVRP